MGAALRPLGSTGLQVSAVTLGGAPLGSMPENFGYEVAQDDAVQLVLDVLGSDIRSIDTANGYSAGRSEERIGLALRRHGGLPPDVLVSTKVDPAPSDSPAGQDSAVGQADYSAARVRASLAESRSRLGLDDLPLVYLHDPEFHDFDEMTGPDGAVDELVRARERGEIAHLGLAGGTVHEMARYLELGVFEVLLVHNRWTLLDRSAGPLMARAAELGVGVVNAAVLGGGILADRSGRVKTYGYRPAPPELLDAVAAMRAVCQRWGTDLATAAIRFSTRQSAVATTIVGISKPERIEQTLTAARADLPEDFWTELEALVPPPYTWLDASHEPKDT